MKKISNEQWQFPQNDPRVARRRAELAERKAIAARSAEANLRRYVALIRAAGSDEAAMEHLSCFANNADVYGLGAEWPESEEQ